MFRLSRRLRSESSLRIVVVGNYLVGPITAEPCRAKARPLHPRRSYFAPMSGPRNQLFEIKGSADFSPLTSAPCWLMRWVLPQVPNGLLRMLIIALSGLTMKD